MIELLIGLVAGFVAGALVFRNNAKKGEALIAKGQEVAAESGFEGHRPDRAARLVFRAARAERGGEIDAHQYIGWAGA